MKWAISAKIFITTALPFFFSVKQVCSFSSWKSSMRPFDIFKLRWRKDSGLHYLENTKERAEKEGKKEENILGPYRHPFQPIITKDTSLVRNFMLRVFGEQFPLKLAEAVKSTSSGFRRCVFSINGEEDGTLVYHNVDGKFHFQGFVTYPPPKDDDKDTKTPMRGTFVKTPSILFDDPLPVLPSFILVALGNIFLINDHVKLIQRMREIITSPLDGSERIPEIGSKAKLSYGFVELAEFVVTPELTWRPKRFITRHRSLLGKEEKIDWPLGNRMKTGKVREDPVFISNNHDTHQTMRWCLNDHPNFILSEKKLQLLLECQVSLVPLELMSKYIAKGIADNMNGTRGF